MDTGHCTKCGAVLTCDDCGMFRKIYGTENTEFLCLGCIADKYGMPEEKLREKAEYLKKHGCTLFYI